MFRLLIICIIGMILCYSTDVSNRIHINGNGTYIYSNKKRISFILAVIILCVYAGLRTRGNDTGTYRDTYNYLAAGLSALKRVNWSIGANPGYIITAIVLKTLGLSTQDYLMVYSAATIGIYLWFIRKYSSNLTLSVFLFITMGCYTFVFAALKQCIAIAIGLIGIDRCINKKMISFIIWIAIATLFHPYVFLFFAAPFLQFTVWSKWSYVLLGASIVVGLMLNSLTGAIVSLTDSMGETFQRNSFNGAGVSIFRVLVVSVPVGLSFITKRKYLPENYDDSDVSRTRLDNLFVNLTMINAAIMFIGLFGTANYFARLANYFLIFQAISYPIVFSKYSDKSRSLLLVLAVVLYIVYFVFETNYVQGAFSARYSFMGFFEYLKMHF